MTLQGNASRQSVGEPVIKGDSRMLDLIPPTSVALADANVEWQSAMLDISALVRAGSPRSRGVDPAHVQRLVEAEGQLPPIIVSRTTMRIVDGYHRVAAATLRGDDQILAHLVDGPEESMFVLAVRANVTHGLPLSLSDRRAAADRILLAYPDWSDRAIASATGLSPKTVCHMRRSSVEEPRSHKRLGKDGRLRPLDASVGRRIAADLLSASPASSLRTIAAAAGVSPSTVRDVRARLSRGDDPVTNVAELRASRQRGRRPSRADGGTGTAPYDVAPVLLTLSKDPALRMNCAGRQLLRWLHAHAVHTVESAHIVQQVPDHCVEHLIELANRCAANWTAIAKQLEAIADHRAAKANHRAAKAISER